MRLGGPLFDSPPTPEEWVESLRREGYRAAYRPVGPEADEATVRAYVEAAAAADIVIAEVGAWSNPISPNEAERRKALELCKRQLALAERLGARCCVNIAGSRHPEQWDGPHPDNLAEATFDLIVDSVREIIDAVAPRRTCYSLETMPWIYPDSPESYLRLIEAIDRPAFAVHFDPVNLINCPERAFQNGRFLRHCFDLLGPHIRSCHAKDIILQPKLTVHLDEARPGLGCLDYGEFLRQAARLPADTPIMLEHLPSADEYRAAASHLRAVAEREGVVL